jgi:hypothetical protein
VLQQLAGISTGYAPGTARVTKDAVVPESAGFLGRCQQNLQTLSNIQNYICFGWIWELHVEPQAIILLVSAKRLP